MTLDTAIKILKIGSLACTLGGWAAEMLLDDKTTLRNNVLMKRMVDKAVDSKIKDMQELKIQEFLNSVKA